MAGLFRSKNVVHVEDVVTVFVVIAIVLGTLARLGQDSARIARGLILEARVTDAISSRQLNSKSLKRLIIS